MSLMDEIIKTCPRCGLQGNLKQFLGWHHDNRKGYIGKTLEGHYIILCPKCLAQIRYNINTNEFTIHTVSGSISMQDAKSITPLVLGIGFLICSLISFLYIPSFFRYVLGLFFFVFGWMCIRSIFISRNQPPQRTDFEDNPSIKESHKYFDDR